MDSIKIGKCWIWWIKYSAHDTSVEAGFPYIFGLRNSDEKGRVTLSKDAYGNTNRKWFVVNVMGRWSFCDLWQQSEFLLLQAKMEIWILVNGQDDYLHFSKYQIWNAVCGDTLRIFNSEQNCGQKIKMQ